MPLIWNDHTFKQLTKEAKLIDCFLEAHCSTAGFLQADESDIAANGIGLERRTGLNPFGDVVVLAIGGAGGFRHLSHEEIMTLS